uniref:LBH domain-containing protein n=1 Tax=Sander lucioperca TaxID=283035 RepID=A0A8C9ZAC1_SANLU
KTEVMNTCESTGGGASAENVMVSRCVPSIVVEPTVGGQVESGELRWPPDDVTEGQVTGEVITSEGQVTIIINNLCVFAGVPVEEAEPEEPAVGGV